MLLLQTGALDETTSGLAIPSKPENTAYVWAGEGPFDSTKVTADTFYNFLTKFLTIFNINSSELQLASFTVNLSKITVAGLTLTGVIQNDNKPLSVIVGISKEALKEKLMQYSTIVTKFFETYKIEVYNDKQIIHVASDLFDKMQAADTYQKSLAVIVKDFKNKSEINSLPGIDLFNIDCAVSELKHDYPTWNIKSNDSLKINALGIGYSFSFMFGDKTFYGSIAYSLWSAVYLPNLYLQRG